MIVPGMLVLAQYRLRIAGLFGDAAHRRKACAKKKPWAQAMMVVKNDGMAGSVNALAAARLILQTRLF
jgi:hypothetical protein